MSDLEHDPFPLDERADWQDKVSRLNYLTLYRRLRNVGVGLCIGLLAIGFALMATKKAAHEANEAAESARLAGECSSLLLASVAARRIDEAAVRLGCDIRAAVVLIDRTRARDDQSRAVTCGLLPLFEKPDAPEIRAFEVQFGCPRR